MFGYTAQEMLGEPLLALLPPDRQDEEQFILEKILAGEKVDHFEKIRVRKDGTLIEASITISPIRDRDGRVMGTSEIARDITCQKKAEARLQLTSSVFTHTREAIVITDDRGIIIEANDAFARITGDSRDEAVGRTARMFGSS